MPKTSSLAAGTALLVGRNDETPKVGSGARRTDDAGAPSGRVTTRGDAPTNGASR